MYSCIAPQGARGDVCPMYSVLYSKTGKGPRRQFGPRTGYYRAVTPRDAAGRGKLRGEHKGGQRVRPQVPGSSSELASSAERVEMHEHDGVHYSDDIVLPALPLRVRS